MDDDELVRRAMLGRGGESPVRPADEARIRRIAGQVRAIREIGPAALQFEVERSERRVSVLGILFPYLSPLPWSWDAILDRLSAAERTLVDENLHGDETVGELFS
jgi:hypothetical protein